MCGVVLMWSRIVRVVPDFTWKETHGSSRRDVIVFSEKTYSLKGPMVFRSKELVGVILLYFPHRIVYLSFEDYLSVGTYIPI
jgi:hypothetical protein